MLNNLKSFLKTNGVSDSHILKTLNQMSTADNMKLDTIITSMPDNLKSIILNDLKICWYKESPEDFIEGLLKGILYSYESDKSKFIDTYINTGAITEDNCCSFGLTVNDYYNYVTKGA